MSSFPEQSHCPLCAGPDTSWVFHPGMLFDSWEKWWTPDGHRASRHEGLDLCLVQGSDRETRPLQPGTLVTAAAKGRVVATIPDFLGHTVICSHGPTSLSCAEWISLIAHIQLDSRISPGLSVQVNDPLGWSKAFPKPRGMLCHVHLSFGWLQTPGDYALTWPDLVQRKRVSFLDPLTLLSIPALLWTGNHTWFPWLDGMIQE